MNEKGTFTLTNPSVGRKDDDGKLDWTILPWSALEHIVAVMEYGASRYGRDNWKLVKPTSRYMAAAFRHLIAHEQGEVLDPESEFPHLAHAATNILFLLQRSLEGESV